MEFLIDMDTGDWKQIDFSQAISMRRHTRKKDLSGLIIQRA
jgi:hypothetical protein